ncbi:MAG TPA: cupin domain-containing protein [Burkholderiaceae bacterium]|jgi:anti-sigma factor ChrR (cupin superfamily)|nr:cupin domain-containing protein [Burkholderiaceae bacterium]
MTRFAGPRVNDDPTRIAVVDTNAVAWEPTEHSGIHMKTLERFDDPRKGRETALVKFDPGASLPEETLDHRMEIFVISGTYSDGHGDYTERTFIRNPPGFHHRPTSKDGCVIYWKRRVPIYKNEAQWPRLVVDAKTAQWLEFPHRGADVLHLYRDPNGLETARIGHVHTERKIPSHDHSIGEETLVIQGCLTDQYQPYEAGVWFRMPCGVPHAPYTGDRRCMMLIREGDLVW